MSTPRDSIPRVSHREHTAGHGAHGGHGWMMIACCIPMLVIAVVLVATGVVGYGFIFAALMCAVMMAVMMRGMGHGVQNPGPGGHDDHADRL